MPNYNTNQPNSQVLDDTKIDWRCKKLKTLRLCDIYKAAGYQHEAVKAKTCSTWLQFKEASREGKKKVVAGNYCNLRLCPACTARRATKAAVRLSHVLHCVREEHPNTQYIFLTLTIKNAGKGELVNALNDLIAGWNRLLKQRAVERAVKGWFRAVEITYSKDKGYHPHIHAILAVEIDYFLPTSNLYITQPNWVDRWAKALRVSYKPIVGIQSTYTKGRPRKAPLEHSAVEAAKYACKDADYINPKMSLTEAAEVVKEYTETLRGRRLTAYGGWFIAPSKDKYVPKDDVMYDLLTTYNWSFGAGDYLLTECVHIGNNSNSNSNDESEVDSDDDV